MMRGSPKWIAYAFPFKILNQHITIGYNVVKTSVNQRRNHYIQSGSNSESRHITTHTPIEVTIPNKKIHIRTFQKRIKKDLQAELLQILAQDRIALHDFSNITPKDP